MEDLQIRRPQTPVKHPADLPAKEYFRLLSIEGELSALPDEEKFRKVVEYVTLLCPSLDQAKLETMEISRFAMLVATILDPRDSEDVTEQPSPSEGNHLA